MDQEEAEGIEYLTVEVNSLYECRSGHQCVVLVCALQLNSRLWALSQQNYLETMYISSIIIAGLSRSIIAVALNRNLCAVDSCAQV